LAPPTGCVRTPCRPREVLSSQAVPRSHLVGAGREALPGLGYRGSGFWEPPGRYFRLLQLTGFSLVQFLESAHFYSENPLLPLARERGRAKYLFVTLPPGSVVESHSTPGASSVSAATLAHSSVVPLPSIPWWLGHQRISIWMFDSLALTAVMCRLVSRAYCCPGPGSSEVILARVALRRRREVFHNHYLR